MDTRLNIRQSQSLNVTLQMQQSLKLLQLSNLELDAYVEAQCESNPLLVNIREDSAGGAMIGGDETLARNDWTPRDDVRELSAWTGDSEGRENAAYAQTLAEVLIAQLALNGFERADHAIAMALIDELDDAGFMRTPLSEIGPRLACSPERVEAVLLRLHSFEPVGVFARDLPECLAIQLKDRNRFDPAMSILLENLDKLARRDFAGLRRACGVDDQDLEEMVSEIRSLTPRPGAGFDLSPVQVVVPDVFVRGDAASGWSVELNAATLPKLLVDRRYHALVQTAARSSEEKLFVSTCLGQANWLARSLDQRAKTILKVTGEIVRQQSAFLEHGVERLAPLTLKVVADATGAHESTVSRVTSNKYLSTPRGVFELKFFFTATIHGVDGSETYAAEAVRHKIRTLIDGERHGGKVLSDDKIVDLLKANGVDLARRTVAKYRDVMGIPSSAARRRMRAPMARPKVRTAV